MVSRDEAVEKAKTMLAKAAWANECDEGSARVIESNECINVLFRYRAVRKPQEIMVGVDKKSGSAEWIRLG